jgi:hypothetical protein
VVFQEESGQNQNLKIVARDVDASMLDALEDYVKRQKKRLGITPQKKEAAN